MHEQRPDSETPYQLPTENIAQQRLNQLEKKAAERQQLERRLSELEAEADELRVDLGQKSSKTAVIHDIEWRIRDEYKSYEAEQKTAALELLSALEIAEETPIVIQRRKFVDLDQAGGYNVDTRFMGQKSGNLLLVEKTVIQDDSMRVSQLRGPEPYTVQYLVGDNLTNPLKIEAPAEHFDSRTFIIGQTSLCDWYEMRVELETFAKELETDRLRDETLALLGDAPLVEGRWPGEPLRYKELPISDTQRVEVIARYWQEQGRDILHRLAILQLIDSDVLDSASFEPESGEFEAYERNSYSSQSYSEAKQRYRQALTAAKALLVRKTQ